MTTYSRPTYGANPLAGAYRNNAQARGWGPGWPNAQESKMLTVAGGGVKVRVRREIGPLVQALLTFTATVYHLNVGECWGFANRAIRGTQTASNHSWGLAVDLNAPDNPMSSTFRTNIPPAVVHAWEASGFYWGGRYVNTPDAMHFEYVGRPADVAADLARARQLLAPPPPEEGFTVSEADRVIAFLQKEIATGSFYGRYAQEINENRGQTKLLTAAIDKQTKAIQELKAAVEALRS
jgi:hypothetical protein